MKPLTKDQQIENLLVAQAMFQDIDNENIDLHTWNSSIMCSAINANRPLHACGSTACFGGYIAIHPHFKKLGVRRGPYGVPLLSGLPGTKALSHYLFGHDSMFVVYHWASKLWSTEQQEVLSRIQFALNNLLTEDTAL